MQPNKDKLEFFTLDSRISMQRGNVYQKKVKQDTDVFFFRLIVFAAYCFLVVFTLQEIKEEGKYFGIIRVLVFGILLERIFSSIYQTLFVKTWRSIIPLKDVTNISTKPLQNGLETRVTLHLSSGRKKFYTFRNAEGQLELFTEAVSAHLAVPAQAAL